MSKEVFFLPSFIIYASRKVNLSLFFCGHKEKKNFFFSFSGKIFSLQIFSPKNIYYSRLFFFFFCPFSWEFVWPLTMGHIACHWNLFMIILNSFFTIIFFFPSCRGWIFSQPIKSFTSFSHKLFVTFLTIFCQMARRWQVEKGWTGIMNGLLTRKRNAIIIEREFVYMLKQLNCHYNWKNETKLQKQFPIMLSTFF